jgi:uncharacterized protein YqcC (DUF446 family)
MEYPDRLATLLQDIEHELQRLELWEIQAPPAPAFRSPNPFCFDTMSMPQWLQWVFIPRMRETLSMGVPLPAASRIAPAVEVYFQDVGGDCGELLTLLEEFDALMPEPVTC